MWDTLLFPRDDGALRTSHWHTHQPDSRPVSHMPKQSFVQQSDSSWFSDLIQNIAIPFISAAPLASLLGAVLNFLLLHWNYSWHCPPSACSSSEDKWLHSNLQSWTSRGGKELQLHLRIPGTLADSSQSKHLFTVKVILERYTAITESGKCRATCILKKNKVLGLFTGNVANAICKKGGGSQYMC